MAATPVDISRLAERLFGRLQRHVPERWRKAVGLYALTASFCVLVAIAITVATQGVGKFGTNLLFSECIGLSIATLATALRRLPRLRDLPEGIGLGIAIALASPFGYLLGYVLAYTVLGKPITWLSLGEGRRVGVLATVLASGFMAYYAFMRHRLAREAAARAEAQRFAAEAQLRLLRAQLEPHMLFNTLATLRALIDDDPRQAQQMIDRLIVYLRSALAASRTETTSLRQEFTQLRAYLEIMAWRMGPRLRFSVDLPEDLANVAVPTMLLQPLVENAIKHGLEPQIGEGTLEVAARRVPGAIELSVADTGLGLAEGEEPGANYGLLHVRERLQAVYGAAATLSLQANAPRGARAVVRIPP